MDPTEINAGRYYLRQLRADDRIDDRPPLVTAFSDELTRRWVRTHRINDLTAATDYIGLRASQWQADEVYSWAIADQNTGELLGEVVLKYPATSLAEAGCWTHPGHRGQGIAATALAAVLRFGFGALDLRTIAYRHAECNHSSRRIAEKLALTYSHREPDDDQTSLRLVWLARPSA